MIKILRNSIREYKFVSLITPLFMAIEVAMETSIVFIIGNLINDLEKGNTSSLAKYSILLVIMALVSLLAGVCGGVFGAKASSGFASNLRHDLFYKIQDFSFENIDNFQTSSLVTRLTTDVSNVQMAYQMILRIAIRVPLIMIFSIVMAFIKSAELAWIYVIFLPLLGLGLFLIIMKAMPTFRKLFKRYDKLNNSVQENVRGIRVVKAYVREEYETKKFNQASDELRDDFTKVEKLIALNSPLMQLCIQSSIVLISYLSAKTICTQTGVFTGKYSSMQTGDYSTLITYGIQMLTGMMMLSFIFVMLSLSYECAKRICEVLNTKSNLTNPIDPIFEVPNGDIDFEDVSFKYSIKANEYALSNVNLHIKRGMTVGIIGGTGSSKTTLVNLISRLYDTTTGIVSVGGINVKNYDITSLRNQVSVVLQKNLLFTGTIKDNLRWGNPNATDEEMIEACKLAQADEFIEGFKDKYDTFIEQGGTNVSGGQKQRLCIARALLKKPKILILDDSTSAVDTKTDALIRTGFKNYIPDTTKIIIAQRISSIMDSDLIVVLDNGTINGMGTHDELLKNNKIYQEVYYTQNKVGGTNA